ncbi:aerobic-type carbon monoxide dehydrogenase small subunit (CoxS/CutS family) [Pseudomonas sp. TE3786]
MTTSIALHINGKPLSVAPGTSVAAALYLAGDGSSRTSVSGQRRAPLCGMGICQECRVTIDGQRRLACQTPCSAGMQVETQP